MFNIGIYTSRIYRDRYLFLFAPNEGFEISNSKDLSYSNGWSDEFKEIDNTFILSKDLKYHILSEIKQIKQINITREKQLEIMEFLSPNEYIYKIKNNILFSKKGLIKIKDISRIEKISEDTILLNISGEMKTILCNEYDKLFKLMIEKEEL